MQEEVFYIDFPLRIIGHNKQLIPEGAKMDGIFREDRIEIINKKNSIKLFQNGYGSVNSSGNLDLSLMEATYLVEKGKLKVQTEKGTPVELATLYEKGSLLLSNFEILYPVYRDLSNRGLIVKKDDGGVFSFIVYENCAKTNFKEKKLKYRVFCNSERAKITFTTLSDLTHFLKTEYHTLDIGKNHPVKIRIMDEKKEPKTVIAVIDEEGDLTYYRSRILFPVGNADTEENLCLSGFAVLVGERSIIWDKKLACDLFEKKWFGNMEEGILHISLLETLYLLDKKVIQLLKNKEVFDLDKCRNYAKQIEPNIDGIFLVYKLLRELKLIPKTGFKFGSHFRVYENNQKGEHAPYLIHVLSGAEIFGWQEISRGVRLAHSVRKKMVFAVVEDSSKPSEKIVTFLNIQRFSP